MRVYGCIQMPCGRRCLGRFCRRLGAAILGGAASATSLNTKIWNIVSSPLLWATVSTALYRCCSARTCFLVSRIPDRGVRNDHFESTLFIHNHVSCQRNIGGTVPRAVWPDRGAAAQALSLLMTGVMLFQSRALELVLQKLESPVNPQTTNTKLFLGPRVAARAPHNVMAPIDRDAMPSKAPLPPSMARYYCHHHAPDLHRC